MNNISELRAFIDKTLARVIAKTGDKITCAKGCFSCCKEPVYADSAEVRMILDSLTSDRKETLHTALLEWHRLFRIEGFDREDQPSAFRYRPFNLWCPLLDRQTGECTVYENRPKECRLHLTKGPKSHCDDDELRPKQKFAMVPELLRYCAEAQMSSLDDGETVAMDHLCILLLDALTGQDHATQARMEMTRTGGEVELKSNKENS
jgi:Fe-S-cluster containining protein